MPKKYTYEDREEIRKSAKYVHYHHLVYYRSTIKEVKRGKRLWPHDEHRLFTDYEDVCLSG